MAAAEFKGGHNDQHADGIVEDRKQSPPIYFYILFFGLILWGGIFCAYYLFSGWSSSQEFQEKMSAHNAAYQQTAAPQAKPAVATAKEAPPLAQPATGSIDPQALFAAKCAGCHGADGKGGYGPDLTSSEYKFGKTLEAVKTSITEGREGKMPAFGSQLSTAEIEALAGFILKL